MHTQTHAHARSLNPSLFWRGNALFVPGHLVKTLTADLLLSPAMVINHSAPPPPKHIHAVTHRPAPSAYSCTPRQIPSLYVLWQYSSPFFHQSAISCAASTGSVPGPISSELMVDVGPFLHEQSMNTPFPTFTLSATTLSFF